MFELQNVRKIFPVPKTDSIKTKGQGESMTSQFLTLTDKRSVSDSIEPTMPNTQGAEWTRKL
jgi:hypothetical protein